MCNPCFQEAQAETNRRSWEHEQRYGETYLKDAAKQDLIAAGIPPVRVRIMSVSRRRVVETKKLFGSVKRTPEDYTVDIWAKGWIIGEFSWHYLTYQGYGGETKHSGQFLTAMIDPQSINDHDGEWRNLYTEDLFVAVRKLNSENEYHATHTAQLYGHGVDDLKGIIKAIHQLTGT
jgi:hypothetical protein